MNQPNIPRQGPAKESLKNQVSEDVDVQKRDNVERRRRFYENWKIGTPVGLALGAGIGFAAQNLVAGIFVGVICVGFSGFVVAFLKLLIKNDP